MFPFKSGHKRGKISLSYVPKFALEFVYQCIHKITENSRKRSVQGKKKQMKSITAYVYRISRIVYTMRSTKIDAGGQDNFALSG